MNIRIIISSIVLGYVLGGVVYEIDPQFANFTLYTLIPFGITLDE